MSVSKVVASPWVIQGKETESAQTAHQFAHVLSIFRKLKIEKPHLNSIIHLSEFVIHPQSQVSKLLVGGHAEYVQQEVAKTRAVFQKAYDETSWFRFHLKSTLQKEIETLNGLEDAVTCQLKERSTAKGAEESLNIAIQSHQTLKEELKELQKNHAPCSHVRDKEKQVAQAKWGIEECQKVLREIKKYEARKQQIDWSIILDPKAKEKLRKQQKLLAQMGTNGIYTNLMGGFVFLGLKALKPEEYSGRYLHISPKHGLFEVNDQVTSGDLKEIVPIVEKHVKSFSVAQLSTLSETVRKTHIAFTDEVFSLQTIQTILTKTLRQKKALLSKSEKIRESQREVEVLKGELNTIQNRLEGKKFKGMWVGEGENEPNVKGDIPKTCGQIKGLVLSSHAEQVKQAVEKTKSVFQKVLESTFYFAISRRLYLKTQLRALEELATAAETQQQKCQAAG